MLVHHRCAPAWRLHTELCKFLQNISTNICGLEKRTDLKLEELSCSFISYNITISRLYPLNGFRLLFFFLLRAVKTIYNVPQYNEEMPTRQKIAGFHITSLIFKLQNYIHPPDFFLS